MTCSTGRLSTLWSASNITVKDESRTSTTTAADHTPSSRFAKHRLSSLNSLCNAEMIICQNRLIYQLTAINKIILP